MSLETLVAEGVVTLATIALLRPHLTEDNHRHLLAAARHRSKREVEHQVACLAPKADVASLVRRIPAHTQVEGALLAQPMAGVAEATVAAANTRAAPLAAPPLAALPTAVLPPPTEPRSHVAPLAADRYLLRVTLSAATIARLRRAQALMGHRVPGGDPAAIIDEALSRLVEHLERTKFSQRRPRRQSGGPSASSPPPSASADGSRHIPAAMRRQVWSRDDGRCAFVGTRGRCTETRRLEFHHVIPFARGGPTTIGNLALRCRSHNGYESELAFGPRVRRGTGLTSETDPPDETGRQLRARIVLGPDRARFLRDPRRGAEWVP